jgi:hypothetical protein
MVEGKGFVTSTLRLSRIWPIFRGARLQWSAPRNRFASPYVPTFRGSRRRNMVGLTDAVNNTVDARSISTWTGPRFGMVGVGRPSIPFMSRLLPFVGQSFPSSP